jgi:hypothetical protein
MYVYYISTFQYENGKYVGQPVTSYRTTY